MLPNRTFIRQDTFQTARSRLARGGLNNDNVAQFEPGFCRALLIEYQGSHLSFLFSMANDEESPQGNDVALKAHAASGDAIDNEVDGAWDASATVAGVRVDFW